MKPLLIIIIPLFLLTASCSVLRNRYSARSDSLVRREASYQQRIADSSTIRQQHLFILSDSSDQRYLTEIIPDGPFHYSQSDGFSGKASAIRIGSSLKTGSAIQDISAARATKQATTETEQRDRQLTESSARTKENEVKKTGTGISPLWVVVLIAAVGVLLYRKYLPQRYLK